MNKLCFASIGFKVPGKYWKHSAGVSGGGIWNSGTKAYLTAFEARERVDVQDGDKPSKWIRKRRVINLV